MTRERCVGARSNPVDIKSVTGWLNIDSATSSDQLIIMLILYLTAHSIALHRTPNNTTMQRHQCGVFLMNSWLSAGINNL